MKINKKELKKFFSCLYTQRQVVIDGKSIKLDSETDDSRFRFYPVMDGSVIKIVYSPKSGKRNLSEEGKYYQENSKEKPQKGKVFIGNLIWVGKTHLLMNNFLVQPNNMDWTPTTLILDRIEEVEV